MKVQIKLYRANDFDAFCENTIFPWFKERNSFAWKEPGKNLVLVPWRSYGDFLKENLLKSGLGHVNIAIWTPDECRNWLLQQLGDTPKISSRENLQLMLMAAAECHLKDLSVSTDDEVSLTAQAVLQDPSELISALDQITQGGWDLNIIQNKALDPILSSFSKILEHSSLQTVQKTDRWLLEVIKKHKPFLKSLLMLGFDGSHWPSWNILRTMVETSEIGTLCFLHSSNHAEKVDEVWISSWKKLYEESNLSLNKYSATKISPSEEFQNPNKKIIYRVGKNLREQADAVVWQAVTFLAGKKCTRLGILFPDQSPLSRETASLLAYLQIPHNDVLGYYGKVAFDTADQIWAAWLAFQKNRHLKSFFQLLQFFPATSALSIAEIKNAFRDAVNEVLMDDFRVLAVFLAASSKKKHQEVARILDLFLILPEKATFSEFIQKTEISLAKLGFEHGIHIIQQRAGPLITTLQQPFTRNTYLRWITAAISSSERIRNGIGNQPYSRVHLLPYAQAENQNWSHLIFTGLNEGQWPSKFKNSTFLSQKQIEALNSQILEKDYQNRRYFTPKLDKAYCLGATEYYYIAQRQFLNLLKSAQKGLCVCASLVDESKNTARLLPNDFLVRLFLADQKTPLTDEQMSQLQKQTSEWLLMVYKLQHRIQSSPISGNGSEVVVPIKQVQYAFKVRRSPLLPFGKYEFALETSLKKPMLLTCKEWEEALKFPAATWLKHMLGVKAEKEWFYEEQWPLAVGTWVHQWLAYAGNPIRSSSTLQLLKSAIKEAAQITYEKTKSAFANSNQPLPPWWIAGWKQAIYFATQLAKKINSSSDWMPFATEFQLPKEQKVKISAKHVLCLNGRIDLILSRTKQRDGDDTAKKFSLHGKNKLGILPETELWVIDYKTGQSKPLILSRLWSGHGVQVALYALALRAMGTTKVIASLVTPDAPLNPQLNVEEIQTCKELWEGLCHIQDTAIFGMLGELRPEFSYSIDYPLATLGVDPSILEEKWIRSHPKLNKMIERIK